MVLSPTRARHLSVEVRGDRETRGDGPKTSKGTLPLRTFLSGHSQTAMLSQTVVAICIVVLFFQGVLTYFFFNAKSSTLPPRHLQANEVRDNRRSVLMEIAPLTHTAAGQERLAKLLLQWYGVQIQLPQISGDPIEHRDFWNGTYIDGVFSQTEYIYQETRQSLSRAYEEEKTIAFKRASLSVPENKDGVQWRPEPWDETRGMYLWDWFLDSYTCHSRQRIGRVGDGGKWVCGLATMKDLDRCIVYSYGIRDDVSFELDLIARTGCEVHAFDPSIGALPDAVPDELVRTGAFTWHKQALSSVTGSVDTFMNAESLLDTMVRLGHAKLTLLKVDIEGSEWGVFSSLFSNARAGVGKPLRLLTDQLLIELHYRDVDSAFEFFEGMESEGFRIFSRETNYHPCVSGRGLPTAVEYSFIHPFFFRDFNRKRGSFSGNVAPTEKKKVSRNILRGVVFALVSTKRLRLLQRMMASLEKYFNRRWKYPIVLFTDEELPLAVQQSLVASSSSQLRFKKVSFDIPSFLEKERIPERTTCSPHSSTVGYRHMCRFMSQQVHQLLDDMGYSWHWRLDDDSILTADIGYDVFQFMENNGKKYGFVNTVMDGPECVKGLWEFTDRFLNRSLGKSVFYNEWPRGQVFYNNFEISHSSVWRSSRYRSFFEQVDREGGIYYNRWGDAAIKSIGVSLVVAESAIHRFSDIGYTHTPFVKQIASGLPLPGKISLKDLQTHLTAINVSMGQNETLVNETYNVTRGGVTVALSGMSPRSQAVIFVTSKISRLALLRRMMASLEKYFNRRWKYPIVLFTDEELPLAVQQSLVASSSSQLRFKKVSFDIPSFLEKERIPERTTCSPHSSTVGYRHMCRFMSQQVHQLLDDMGYSWHWRLDDDSILTADIGYDVFQFMENNGKKYGFVNTVMDGPECVKGLWEFTDRFLNRSLGKSVFYNEWPRGQVFYNNFEISHSSVWRSSRYRSFFEQVDREGGIYYNRWSDSAIKSIGVSLVVAESAIHRFSDIGYTHAPFVKQNGAFELEQMEDDKQPIAALKGTRFVPMKANDLQSRFMQDAGRHHWHGGDCATSFAIPSGRSLWLFGDSFVRSGMKQKLLRNTVSYFDGSKFEFLWRTKGAEVSEAIPLEALPNNEFWWIVAGLYYYEGKEQKAILLAQRVRATTEGFANVGYTIVGTTVLVVRNSYLPVNKWQYKWKNIPYTSARENWFSGISLVNGLRNISTSKLDEVYLVGNRGNPQSIHGSFQTLAKITVGALLDLDFSRMHVWSRVDDRGVGKHIWIPYISGHLHAPAALFSPAVSELSLTYHPHLAVWYVFVIQNGYLNLRLATTPTGPWDILPLMRIPYPFNNNALYHVYAAKSHPELAKETNMVVSYMVNSMTGLPDANASIYTPQFVRVELFSDFSRSPEFRPDCSACEHLPPDPAVFGHFAGLNCKCLDVAMGSASWKRAYSNETRFVLFPDGPFHLSRLLGQSAILYLNLVKDVVLNRHYRDRPALIDGHDHPRFEDALTMIGSRRLDNLQALLETIIEHQIDGDFIETGAWRGGACLFAAAMFKAHHQWPNRRVFAADSFRGIPPVRPNIYPVDIIHEGAEKLSSHEQNSPELLKRQFELFGLWSASQIRILPGYFNESLSLANSRGMFDKFALLRLDGDTYESTIEALDVLYPRLSIGGFVVVDDYLDWIGARQATLDFRRKHRIGIGQEGTGENLVAIYHAHGEIPRGVWWQKMRHVN